MKVKLTPTAYSDLVSALNIVEKNEEGKWQRATFPVDDIDENGMIDMDCRILTDEEDLEVKRDM